MNLNIEQLSWNKSVQLRHEESGFYMGIPNIAETNIGNILSSFVNHSAMRSYIYLLSHTILPYASPKNVIPMLEEHNIKIEYKNKEGCWTLLDYDMLKMNSNNLEG